KKYIWIEDRLVPIKDEKGIVTEVYGSARDITLYHETTLELKAKNEERENLLKELGNRYNELMQFNYIVSHNMRAPVAQLLGLTELLEAGGTEAERTEAINYIKDAAKTMDTMLHDLNTILSTKSKLNEKVE